MTYRDEPDPHNPRDRDRGRYVEEYETYRSEPARGGTGLATASAVVGVLSLLAVVFTLGGLFFIALPGGIAAMVMGVAGRRRRREGRGRALLGLITGLLAVILSVLVIVLVALLATLLDNVNLDGLPDSIRDLAPDDVLRDLEQRLPEAPDIPEVPDQQPEQ
ncbi:MAG TPA: hypothetical protein VGV40_10160 [Solirubrobacteraceae bacterium]|nr:hypothetical protein [Solirubrobacteraceae bacterium]